MSGDDLTIVLFFVATAIALGLTAMTLAGWKHKALVPSLFVVASASAIMGIGWHWFKAGFPVAVTDIVSSTATNPASWFVVFMTGVMVSLVTRFGNQDRPPRVRAVAAPAAVEQPQAIPLSVTEQQFLLSLRAFVLVDMELTFTSYMGLVHGSINVFNAEGPTKVDRNVSNVLIFFLNSLTNQVAPQFNHIKDLARPPIEEMKSEKLQEEIYQFLIRYTELQQYIEHFQRVAQVDTSPWLGPWLKADARALERMQNLKISSHATRIASVGDTFFASAGQYREAYERL